MVRFPASHVLLTRWLNSHMLMVVLVDKSVILLSNSMIKAEGLKWWIIWWLLQGRVESHKKMYCFVFNFQVCLFLGLSWWILIVRHSSTKTLGLKLETIGVQRIWNNWEASCSRSPGRMWSKQEDAKKKSPLFSVNFTVNFTILCPYGWTLPCGGMLGHHFTSTKHGPMFRALPVPLEALFGIPISSRRQCFGKWEENQTDFPSKMAVKWWETDDESLEFGGSLSFRPS